MRGRPRTAGAGRSRRPAARARRARRPGARPRPRRAARPRGRARCPGARRAARRRPRTGTPRRPGPAPAAPARALKLSPIICRVYTLTLCATEGLQAGAAACPTWLPGAGLSDHGKSVGHRGLRMSAETCLPARTGFKRPLATGSAGRHTGTPQRVHRAAAPRRAAHSAAAAATGVCLGPPITYTPRECP